MMLAQAGVIAGFAAAGGMIRAFLSSRSGTRGTLIANTVACGLLGVVKAAGIEGWLLLALGTGLAGALSTWSTLAKEVALDIQGARWKDAGMRTAAHLGLGVAAWYAACVFVAAGWPAG